LSKSRLGRLRGNKKTYKGNGVFNGVWLFTNGIFERLKKEVKMDLVFDWVGDLEFPPKEFDGLRVVNTRKFKELTCDKWAAYKILEEYMPKTLWVGPSISLRVNRENLLDKISTENIVLKPYNGLRGKGIFIGSKDKFKEFKPEKEDTKFILQEFVDTSNGIPGITPGKHDLRIVVVNGKVVWCHVRVPALGTFLANAAQGGNLTEVDYEAVPESVKKIVRAISKKLYDEYDNPVFSLDFGINEKGIPLIFEINDQIGFPKWEMKNRDNFLKALVANFSSKV